MRHASTMLLLLCGGLYGLAHAEAVTTVTGGFHNRGDAHWAGGGDWAVIGIDGTENPLGDRTEPLESTDERLVTIGSQTSEDWDLEQPAVEVTIAEMWDVRGPIQVFLKDENGSIVATLSSASDTYTASDASGFVHSIQAEGDVAALHDRGNAGGYVHVECTGVKVTPEYQGDVATPERDAEAGQSTIIFKVEPVDLEDDVTVTSVEHDASPDLNPRDLESTYAMVGDDDKEWEITEVRWYDDGNEEYPNCIDTSDIEINVWAKYDFGSCTDQEDEDNTDKYGVTLYLREHQGYARWQDRNRWLGNRYAPIGGHPIFTARRVRNGQWRPYVDLGRFTANRLGEAINTFPAAHSFYNMIQAEEDYHDSEQLEDLNDPNIGHLFRLNSFRRYIRAQLVRDPTYHRRNYPNRNRAVRAARNAYNNGAAGGGSLGDAWLTREWASAQTSRCDIEEEAKTAVEATYPLNLSCAYEGLCGGTSN